jgi:hypothetical protein
VSDVPFKFEATINGGPLDGRRLELATSPSRCYVAGDRGMRPLIVATVEIEGRMVPVDIAAQVLAHTEAARLPAGDGTND